MSNHHLQHRQSSPIAYDMASHHALGGGSYVFKTDFPLYLNSLLLHPEERTEINIIIQPNSSPHVGTLCSLGLAFVVAARMKKIGNEVMVVCDLWDRAKGEELVVNDISYQRGLRDTGKFQQHLWEYKDVLANLSRTYGIEHRIRLEEEFLMGDKMGGVVQNIIKKREFFGKYLAPSTGMLAVRAACPKCGLVDKYGVNNIYAQDGSTVSFECPQHGRFIYGAEADTHRFQFNCQLFNLVLGLYYERVQYNYIEICGSDYAGFWQEQLLWRFLTKPILIVYTPLISDWSGSKVSKSLYLQPTAYDYLKKAGQEYLLSYQVLKQEKKNISILWREIERWVDEPYRLFRGYSLHYLHVLFEDREMSLGIIHDKAAEE